MATVDVQELEGDSDQAHVLLAVDRDDVPDLEVDSPASAEVITTRRGRFLLIYAGEEGDVPVSVLELTGDADPDTLHLQVKREYAGEVGSAANAVVLDGVGLLVALPAAAPPPPPPPPEPGPEGNAGGFGDASTPS